MILKYIEFPFFDRLIEGLCKLQSTLLLIHMSLHVIPRQICATYSAFAALADGKVVTWGDPDWGGDSALELEDAVQVLTLEHEVVPIRYIWVQGVSISLEEVLNWSHCMLHYAGAAYHEHFASLRFAAPMEHLPL